MTEAAHLSVVVDAKGIGATRAGLASVDGSLKRTAGSALKATAAFAGIAGAAVGIKKFVDVNVQFDRSMRNVNSLAKLNERQFKQLKNQVLALAGPTAQAPKTLADGMYQLESSGFKAKAALTILKSSAIAATAGLTDTGTATTAVAGVLNAYHLSAKHAAQVSDDLFQTVNLGVLTFENLAQGIGPVLPFAAKLGVNLKQVGAMTATLTKAGIPAAESFTYMKGAMAQLVKPSQNLQAQFKALGVTGGQELVSKTGSLQAALEALYKSVGGNQQAFAKLFPDIRGMTAAFAATGAGAKTAKNDLADFQHTGGTAMAVFKEQSKSVGVQWDKFKAVLAEGAIKLGSKVMPALLDAAKAASKFVTQMIDGDGAGGRFRDMISQIGGAVLDVVRPIAQAALAIGQFFAKNTGLLKGAIVAWGAYKAAMFAATALTKSRLVAQFVGLAPAAKAAAADAGVAMRNGLIVNAASGGATLGSKFAAGAAAALRGFGWAAIGAYILDATGLGMKIAKSISGPLEAVAGAVGDITNAVSSPKLLKVDTTAAGAAVKDWSNALGTASVAEDKMRQIANGPLPRALGSTGAAASGASGKVSLLTGSLGKIPKSKSVNIQTNAASEASRVQSLISLINGLVSKSITITTNFVQTGSAGGRGIGQQTGKKHRAVGGIQLSADDQYIARQQAIIDAAGRRSAALQQSNTDTDNADQARQFYRESQTALPSLKGLKGQKLKDARQKLKDAMAKRREGRKGMRDLATSVGRQYQLDTQDQISAAAQARIDARQKRMERPTHVDYSLMSLAQAQMGGDLGAAQKAAKAVVGDRTYQYNQAVKLGDPRKIAEAAQNLISASQVLKDAGQAIKDAAEAGRDATALGNSAALVMAQVDTPKSTTDDLAALNKALTDDRGFYASAVAAGDNDGITKWGGAILSILDEIKALGADNTQAAQDQLDLWKSIAQDAQRNANTSGAQLAALTGWISGHLGQQVLRSSTTPAAGKVGSL